MPVSLPPDRNSLRVGLTIVLALTCGACDLINKLTGPKDLSIQKFAASPSDIAAGSAATLTWEVQGADSVQLDNDVGTVAAQGSREVRPSVTTTYSLSAHGGTSTAVASVQVLVHPNPNPSPTPNPSPSPSPTPSPSPSPSPTPSPSPSPLSCGVSSGPAGNCLVTITKPHVVSTTQCIEVNQVSANQSCPVGFNTTRSLRFDVTARSSRTNLTWRRASTSFDVIIPDGGTISGNGTTSVLLTDVVLDTSLTIEILDQDTVVLSFTLRHN